MLTAFLFLTHCFHLLFVIYDNIIVQKDNFVNTFLLSLITFSVDIQNFLAYTKNKGGE